MLAIPNERRSVDEVIFHLVRLENGQLSINEGLLRWGDCRVVERQADEINGEGRHVLQGKTYRRARPSVTSTVKSV